MPDYFTLAELRAKPDMADTGRFPDATCEAASAYIVGVIEREVGTSFIHRTFTDEVHDGGGLELVLYQPYARTITSVTEGGTVLGALNYRLRGGVLRRYSSATAVVPDVWAPGMQNIKVTYTAGWTSTPPGDVKEMALEGTRAHLLNTAGDSQMASRRTSLTTDVGTVSFVVAGRDRPTGYPEVDAMIVGWRDRLDVFGFA